MSNYLKFEITADELELQALIKERKAELQAQFDENFKNQEATLSLFCMSMDHCTLNGLDKEKIIWNASGFINLLSLDLKHIIADMMFATDEWKKRLHGRTVSMLIYEALNDIFELLGKDFKPLVQKLPGSVELEAELTAIKSRLSEFKKSHFAKLKKIRNVVTAHREKDILSQISIITGMNWMNVFSYAQEFDHILNSLGFVLQKVISSSVDNL